MLLLKEEDKLTLKIEELILHNDEINNFDNLNNQGFSRFLYSPDPILKKKLARLCFEEYGDPFHMFVLGQSNFPLHMAIKLNIELIFPAP